MQSLRPVTAALVLILVAGFPAPAQQSDPVASATAALQRLVSTRASEITVQAVFSPSGLDTFSYSASGGRLTIAGNSGVALCRGFYDYVKRNSLGQVSWSGNRIALPATLPDVSQTSLASPYADRYYFNVVTYGYTLPYWDWARWQQEIDWMAFHGVNMPLMLVAVEAIGERVWKSLGLTQVEIDTFYTGPAHLPWQRMGNITKHDGPLPASWHTDQIALAHQILARMRELGMKPIVQGFPGFVPRALKRIYPADTLYELSWGGFPADKHAFMLAPSSPRFTVIGQKFIQEWEREFDTCDYYLIDSFNEMELPNTGEPDSVLLANYGGQIYNSMVAGNPSAIWVIQGWMFGYQRSIWNATNVRALLKQVPNDRMFILDEACDYNGVFWNNGYNWELFGAFYNKPWGWGVIPNMGGKTAYTGVMSFYATEPARALNAANRGRLTGFGMCPEGIENNDVLYELLTDMAWRRSALSIDTWIVDYCKNRYGACPQAMTDAWTLLRSSCYGTFTDHPRFGWQVYSPTGGSINKSTAFFRGVEGFLSCADSLCGNPLYQADAIEMTAIYLGLKADEWYARAVTAHNARNYPLRDSSITKTLAILTDLDRLLESHPLDRLDRWLTFARSHGVDNTQKQFYESNARRIITVWGPPINDYSARMWSGLVRDFYRERLSRYFTSLVTGTAFNRTTWEESWVRGTGISAVTPYADPCAAAKSLIAQYGDLPPLGNLGIAYLKPVTATSTQSGYTPAAVTDGDISGSFWSADPYPQSVTIDLQSVARIDSLHVYPYYDGTRYYQYRIEVSTDSTTWTQVVDMSTNTQVSTAAGFAHTIAPRNARYVRITMLRNSANPGVHLYEVRVFGAFLVPAGAARLNQQKSTFSFVNTSRQNAFIVLGTGSHAIDLYSINGRVVRSFAGSGNAVYRVNSSAVRSGVYLARMRMHGKSEVMRLVVR